MTSIVVAVALVAAAGPEPDANVVPAGYFPGGGGAWSGTTSYYGFGREAPYGFGIGPEATNSRLGVYGADGRRFGAPYSPSPYDRTPTTPRRPTTGGVSGGVSVGGYSGVGIGGGIFRRR